MIKSLNDLTDHTLGSTLNVGVASVVPHTPAGGCSSQLGTLRISPTRRGIARLDNFNWPLRCKIKEKSNTFLTCGLTWFLTASKWISDITRLTDAVRDVIPHVTVCIPSTQARTRVDTSLIFACLVSGTVGMVDTLGSAVGRRANHAGQT